MSLKKAKSGTNQALNPRLNKILLQRKFAKDYRISPAELNKMDAETVSIWNYLDYLDNKEMEDMRNESKAKRNNAKHRG